MKILITTDWYKPVINGVVASVDSLCDELLSMGFEVRILTLSGSAHSYKKGNVYYLGSVRANAIYPQARVRIRWDRQMIKELITWKPDIVHSQCEFSTFIPAKRISNLTDAALVHTWHTAYEDYTHYVLPVRKSGCPMDRVGKNAVKIFSEFICNKTGAVIAPSKKVADMLKQYDINSEIYVIPSGIDLDRFSKAKETGRSEVRQAFNIPEDEFLLVYVGRIAKEKNLDEILYMMKNMKDKGQRLLIAGDGPYRKDLEEKAKELGIYERIFFAGMVSPLEVSKYYRAGDLFINASTSETQGLTYIEAMACEVPVLCRRDDCLKDVIKQGTNGFLYDTEEEFNEILDLLKNDKGLRAQIGARAYETAAVKFCAGVFATGCIKLYKSLGKESDLCI